MPAPKAGAPAQPVPLDAARVGGRRGAGPPPRCRRPAAASWRGRAAWAPGGATPPWPTRAARSSSSSPRREAIRSTPTRRRPAGSGPSSGPTTSRARPPSTRRWWATRPGRSAPGSEATWIYASGGRPRARAARMPFEKVPAQWLPYVVVKDLKAALARVTELNGHVLRKPGAKGPQFAVVSDPGGAAFILEQRPEQPADEVAQAPAAGPRPRAAAGRRGAAPRPTSSAAGASRPIPSASTPRSRRPAGAAPRPPPSRGRHHRHAGRRPRRRGGGGGPGSLRQRLDRPAGLGAVLGGVGWAYPRPAGSGRAVVGHAAGVGPRLRASLLSRARRLLPGLPAASGAVPPGTGYRPPAARRPRLPAARAAPRDRRRSGHRPAPAPSVRSAPAPAAPRPAPAAPRR